MVGEQMHVSKDARGGVSRCRPIYEVDPPTSVLLIQSTIDNPLHRRGAKASIKHQSSSIILLRD
jgi:hypothetical protein